MLRLALRNLRARAARTTFTAAAIALGVGLIFAMRLTGATLTESARAARESRLAGADLEITSAASAQIPLSILDTLTARPEIESAAPLYRGLEGKAAASDGTFTMGGGTLEGTGLALLGVDPAHTLTPYELAAGRFLQAEDAAAVLLPSDWAARHGHAVGGRIKLTTGARTDTYAIVGLLKPRREVVVATATAWLPLTTLSAAFDAPQTVTAIQIRLRPDQNSEAARAALQAGLGDQYIVTSAAGSSSLNSLYSVINLALPVAGFAVLLAGAFLVFNAFAITLAERRREIGQLRTLGMTRRQVLTQTLLEAGLVGVFGSALGLLLGLGFGIGMVAIVSAINGYDSAAGAVIPWDAWPLAAGAGVLVTVVVTVGLAREAAQVSALEAFKPPFGSASKRRGRRAWLAGLVVVLLAATAGLYLWGAEYARTALTPSYGPIFAPALTFGAAVVALLPLWLDGLITLLERGQWLAGRLAAASLRRQGSRAAVTAATLTTSFMLVIALTGLTLFMSQFLLSFNLSMFSGQVVLIRPFPPGTSLGGAAALPSLPPLPADLEADLGTLEDVAEVQYFANVAIPGVGVESGAGDQYAFALPLSVIRGKRTFPIAEGSWEDAERIFVEQEPAILLPELTGRKFDKHPGDTIEIDTLKGKVPFTVAAVGGGFPIISPAAAAEYFGSHPFGIIFSPKPGVARAALEARVDALRERHRTELGAFNTEQLTATVETLIGPIQALFGGLTSLSGLVAALGIVVTLFASVLERQREIGTLRALGLRRDEVRGLVVLEAGLLGFAGAGLGALGGLGLAALFSQGMN
nr:ABC transporter permease [Anaerolineales bacterium]